MTNLKQEFINKIDLVAREKVPSLYRLKDNSFISIDGNEYFLSSNFHTYRIRDNKLIFLDKEYNIDDVKVLIKFYLSDIISILYSILDEDILILTSKDGWLKAIKYSRLEVKIRNICKWNYQQNLLENQSIDTIKDLYNFLNSINEGIRFKTIKR